MNIRSCPNVSLGDYQRRQVGSYQQRSGNQQQQNQHRGFQNNQSSSQHQSRFSSRFGNRSQDSFAGEDDDAVIEDPDNLWATPSADAVGSGDFGSFDENGIFRVAGGEDFTMPALRPEEFGFPARASKPVEPAAPASVNASSFFFSSNPVPKVEEPAPAPIPSAIPHITPETQWLYRDPSGHIQGPFSSVRMLDWYNGNYFPESLPLRREQDPFFEPLSSWKIKCGGQVPFSAYSQPKKPEPAPVAPAISPRVSFASTRPAPVDDWFAPKEVPVAQQPAAKPAGPRSVALESLFGSGAASAVSGSISSQASNVTPITAASIEKPGSPEVVMPSTSAWKKPAAAPSISFGNIESEMAQMALESKAKSAEKPAEKAEPAASWGSTGGMKKISLTEILKEKPKVEEAPSVNAPVDVAPLRPQPIVAVPQSAGWAKISTSPVQPLSAIQAEEARREAERRKSSSASGSSSKSFADLVRSATVSDGNILVTASHSPAPSPAPVAPVVRKTDAPRPFKIPEAPVTTAPVAAKPSKPSSVPSVAEWCQNSLVKTPLAKVIDPLTCTTLLLDLPNPAAILNFSLDTLQPLLSSSKESFDLAGFAAELATRKFGREAADKINWSRLATSTQATSSSDFSFETVKNKRK